jgi:hypothetical protein
MDKKSDQPTVEHVKTSFVALSAIPEDEVCKQLKK